MGTRDLFTDEQIWLVMNAPSDINSRHLAEEIGRKHGSVRMLRTRLRMDPWVCRISWEPCGECGYPLIRPTSTKLFHDRCRPAARQKLESAYRETRELRLSEAQRDARMERGAAFHAKVHELTLRTAENRGAPWSEDDDRYLVENYGIVSLTEMSVELGRTYSACHSRLGKLRERGLLAIPGSEPRSES